MALFWRILGWTLLGIPGLVLLLAAAALLVPVEIHAKYDDEFRWQIRFGFLKLGKTAKKLLRRYLDSPEPEISHRKKHDADHPRPTRLQRLQSLLPKLKNVGETVQTVQTYLPALQEAVPGFLRAIHIRKLHVDWNLAGTNAAKTAIRYGEISAALALLTPQLYEVFTVGDLRIRLNPDFMDTKTRIWLDGTVSATLAALLVPMLKLVKLYLAKQANTDIQRKDGKST